MLSTDCRGSSCRRRLASSMKARRSKLGVEGCASGFGVVGGLAIVHPLRSRSCCITHSIIASCSGGWQKRVRGVSPSADQIPLKLLAGGRGPLFYHPAHADARHPPQVRVDGRWRFSCRTGPHAPASSPTTRRGRPLTNPSRLHPSISWPLSSSSAPVTIWKRWTRLASRPVYAIPGPSQTSGCESALPARYKCAFRACAAISTFTLSHQEGPILSLDPRPRSGRGLRRPVRPPHSHTGATRPRRAPAVTLCCASGPACLARRLRGGPGRHGRGGARQGAPHPPPPRSPGSRLASAPTACGRAAWGRRGEEPTPHPRRPGFRARPGARARWGGHALPPAGGAPRHPPSSGAP